MRKILFLSFLSLVFSLTFISTVPAQSNLAPKLSQAPTSQPQPPTGISVGAAKTPASAQEMLDWMIFKYENVPFDFASYQLTPAARKILKRKAEWIKDQDADMKLVLVGHCDQRGSKDYNKSLGVMRANAAKQYLINLGIARDRVRITSAGDAQPLQQGEGEEVWEKNRRVEVRENAQP